MNLGFKPSPRSRFWPISIKALFIIAILVGGVLLLSKAGQMGDIIKALRDANGGWIIIGLLTSGLSYTAGGLTQYAAGNWQGSFQRVHLLQWAGNFINRFLPFSFGTIALATRHYRKQGRRPAEALAVATLPAIIGNVLNIVLIALLAPFTVAHALKYRRLDLPPLWLLPVAVVTLVIVVFLARHFRAKIKRFWKEAKSGLSSIKEPRQLAALLGGSLLFTLLSAGSLYAAIQAMGSNLPLTDVLALYILATFAGIIVPTPGGVGTTETAMVAGFTSLGIGLFTAVSITLLFRLMTFWAPLIPGGIALHFFRKQNKQA